MLFGLFVCVIVFFSCETMMRLYYVFRPHYFISSYYLFRYNPLFGNWHNPNITMHWTREGSARIRTNSYGMIGPECTKAKAPNVIRIAVLGDSFTEALQVDFDKNYPALLETELNQLTSYDKKIEVLNFGVSGQGTAQQLILLQSMAIEFDPDIVVLGFFPGNDIANNCREVQGDAMRPYYTISDSHSLILDAEAQSNFEKFIEKHYSSFPYVALNFVRSSSYFITYLVQWVKSFRDGEIVVPFADKTHTALINQNPIYRDPPHSVYEKGWQITEALLLRVHDYCAAQSIPFILFQITTSEEVDRETRRQYTSLYPADSLDYPSKRIKNFALEHGIRLVQLNEYFVELTNQDPALFFHGFKGLNAAGGHWNSNGHYYGARLLAKYFLDEKLIGS
jgi:hypothetical protein